MNAEHISPDTDDLTQKFPDEKKPSFLQNFWDSNKWRLNPRDPRGIYGELGALKFLEAEDKEDLKGDLTPNQILEHIGGDRIFAKMRQNAIGTGVPRAQAGEFVAKRLNDLYIRQENVGIWSYHPLLKGLTLEEKSKIKVGFSRLNETYAREFRFGGGPAEQIDASLKDAILNVCSGEANVRESAMVKRDERLLEELRNKIYGNKNPESSQDQAEQSQKAT